MASLNDSDGDVNPATSYPWESGDTLNLAALGKVTIADNIISKIRGLVNKTVICGYTSNLFEFCRFVWLAPIGINLNKILLYGTFLNDRGLRLLGRTLKLSCPSVSIVNIVNLSDKRKRNSVGVGLVAHQLYHISKLSLTFLHSQEEAFVALKPFNCNVGNKRAHPNSVIACTGLRMQFGSQYKTAETTIFSFANFMMAIATKNMHSGVFIASNVFHKLEKSVDPIKKERFQWYLNCLATSEVQLRM